MPNTDIACFEGNAMLYTFIMISLRSPHNARYSAANEALPLAGRRSHAAGQLRLSISSHADAEYIRATSIIVASLDISRAPKLPS